MDVNKLCPHCLTEIDTSADKCSHCGKDPKDIGDVKHHLKPLTILQGKYLVGDILGEGGFGITYIGLDINLEIKVAIKEFYPNGYCTRDGKITTELTAYTGDSFDVVTKWKDNFIKEARSLARCSNLPGVVGVKDFFQENNTAYIVQEYLEGMTLKELMKASGGKIAASQLLPAIEPVILALEAVHKQGIIHRDISPDNIMRLKNGQMKLLDFGAARDYAQENEKSLSVLLKPGYAPEEQYRTRGNQGPWSDIYAMAGTIYKCLTGVTPPEALERLRIDELQSPNSLGAGLTPGQEQALLKAMSVVAENRYQSAHDFHAAFYGNADANAIPVTNADPITSSQHPVTMGGVSSATEDKNEKPESSVNSFFSNNKQYIPIYIACGMVVLVCLVGIICLVAGFNKDDGKKTSQATEAQVESPEYEVKVKEEAIPEATPAMEEEIEEVEEEAVIEEEPVVEEEEIEEEEEEPEVVFEPWDIDIDSECRNINGWVNDYRKNMSNYRYIQKQDYFSYMQNGTSVILGIANGYDGVPYYSEHFGAALFYIKVYADNGDYELYYADSKLIRLKDGTGRVYDYGCEEWQDCVDFAAPYERIQNKVRGMVE